MILALQMFLGQSNKVYIIDKVRRTRPLQKPPILTPSDPLTLPRPAARTDREQPAPSQRPPRLGDRV